MRPKTLAVTAATLLLLTELVLAPRALATSYAFTTFNLPGSSTNATFAVGINDAGEIVGYFIDAAMTRHGFVMNGATYTTFDVPGASSTSPSGVNNAGTIVGTFNDGTGAHGFVYDGTTYTTLDVPGATQGTEAFGINDSDQIVGFFYDSSGRHGFLKDGATYTTLDHGSSTGMFAFGINNVSQIVGWFFDTPVVNHGFVYDGATYTTLDVPGAQNTIGADGINSLGDIVGQFVDGSGIHGFLKSGATYTAFDIPGATGGTFAWGINTFGQIVGNIYVASGASSGFLATPISLETQITMHPVVVTVTIFGSATLDVTALDPTALRLGPKQASPDPDLTNPAVIEDMNGDGLPDLVVWFREQDTGLSPDASQACFAGSMSGQTFLACDAIVKTGCGLGFELAPILPVLLWLHGRRRRKRA